jgi:hypothetical protein
MAKPTFQQFYERRARRVALLLAGLPFVRFVGLTGSLARGLAHESSDVDFFVVTSPGRIFTARFFVTLVVHLLGLRRHGPKISGRICLNRYQTSDALEILPHTRYHAEDISQMIPLIDFARLYEQFKLANQWMEKEFGVPFPTRLSRKSRSLALSQFTRRSAEWLLAGRFGDWLEQRLKFFQLRFQVWNPETKQRRTNVVVKDNRLLFHPSKPSPQSQGLRPARRRFASSDAGGRLETPGVFPKAPKEVNRD